MKIQFKQQPLPKFLSINSFLKEGQNSATLQQHIYGEKYFQHLPIW